MSNHRTTAVETGAGILNMTVRLAIVVGLFTACSETSFQAQDAKKPLPKPTQPESGNVIPAGPGGDPTNELDADTNCTGLSEAQCHQKKIDENAKTSYRVVDCTSKPTAECDQMVEQAKVTDGRENSRIIVKECQNDGGAVTCEKIDEKPNVELEQDEKVNDEGINIGGDEKIITSFKFNENVALDGVSHIEFDYATGIFTFGSTDQRFGLVRFQFDFTKANGESGFVTQNGYNAPPRPAISGVSNGSVQIPNWPKQCGVTTTPVQQLRYAYEGGGTRKNKPIINISNVGTQLVINIDDSLNDRGGAVKFLNLAVQLTPCSN